MKLMSILTEAKEQDFKRLPLAYKLSALNPIIDTDTMEEHYKKHYKLTNLMLHAKNSNTLLISMVI